MTQGYDTFLAAAANDRRDAFIAAGRRLGAAEQNIEKDFWVCWTLTSLFRSDRIGENLVFRGGTSLSKGWQCIERFSEDIDLAINRSWVGGEELVELKAVRKPCRTFCHRFLKASDRGFVSF